MPVRYPSTVSGNQTSLQNQIRRSATAPLGPVSVGPGEGHMRYYTSTGDTFLAEPSGASVKFRGGLTGLTPHLESNATKNEDQDGRLDGHDSTLASHDTRITNEVAARKSADTTLHGRVTTEANLRKDADSALSGRVSTAQSRADSAFSNAATAQSRADSAYTRAGNAASAASTAQSRADSAYSRAGTGISDAASAQSRADAAYSRAGTAQSEASTANARASKIINCINGVQSSSARMMSTASIQPMAEADAWQQLKMCLAS